jgi:nucleotide-binding universal stress UspA family protein
MAKENQSMSSIKRIPVSTDCSPGAAAAAEVAARMASDRHAARELRGDLTSMGTHDRSGLAHPPIGSVAEKAARASSVPVMTARAPA